MRLSVCLSVAACGCNCSTPIQQCAEQLASLAVAVGGGCSDAPAAVTLCMRATALACTVLRLECPRLRPWLSCDSRPLSSPSASSSECSLSPLPPLPLSPWVRLVAHCDAVGDASALVHWLTHVSQCCDSDADGDVDGDGGGRGGGMDAAAAPLVLQLPTLAYVAAACCGHSDGGVATGALRLLHLLSLSHPSTVLLHLASLQRVAASDSEQSRRVAALTVVAQLAADDTLAVVALESSRQLLDDERLAATAMRLLTTSALVNASCFEPVSHVLLCWFRAGRLSVLRAADRSHVFSPAFTHLRTASTPAHA
jgi:hypothetical protein